MEVCRGCCDGGMCWAGEIGFAGVGCCILRCLRGHDIGVGVTPHTDIVVSRYMKSGNSGEEVSRYREEEC